MADVGPQWRRDVADHVELMVREFTKIHAGAQKEGVQVTHDVSYGSHVRQRFDMFLPEQGGSRRPILLFVHGGAFTEGSRNISHEIYANVGHYFSRHGIPTLNLGYRLAPEAVYPEASRDVGAVVAWVRQHATELGIDADRIFLMGHSAGAAHAATYAYDSRLQPPSGPDIVGLIVVSGRVRADNLPENPNKGRIEAYYGGDAALYNDRSPVSHVKPTSVPTLVAWSEYENPLLDVYCGELAYRLGEAKGRMPMVVRLQRHNHTSAIAHLNTAEDELGSSILDFIENPR